MSEEEKNVTEEAVETTETQDAVNPYLSKEETATEPVKEEQKKKSPLKVVIPIVIAAVVLIGILAAVFAGAFGNKKKILEKALVDTFKESGEYLAAEWKLEQYKGMFADETMTVDMELSLPEGIGVNMTVQQDEKTVGMYGEATMSGMTLLELEGYLDETSMMFSLPGMLDYVFTVNRETLEEDIFNLVDMEILDEATAEEIIALNKGEIERSGLSEEETEALVKEITKAWKTLYDKCGVDKIDEKEVNVNGDGVKAKGYKVTTNIKDIADALDATISAYENSEEMSKMLENTLMNQGYEDYSLKEAYDEIYAGIDELRKEEEDVIEIKFYLYDGKVAQIYGENKDAAVSFKWDIRGGNFPLENTTIFCGDEIDYFEISRTGSVEKGEYRAQYDIDNGYSKVAVALHYTPENGTFSFELSEDEYSIFYLEGSMEKENDATVVISIDSLEIEQEQIMSGDITVSEDCGKIVKPDGEEKNVLLMSKEDWEAVIWELAMSMYSMY